MEVASDFDAWAADFHGDFYRTGKKTANVEIGLCNKQGSYEDGIDPCTSSGSEGTVMLHNQVWRPNMRSRIANWNIQEPEKHEAGVPYHLLYMTIYSRQQLLMGRSEYQVTNSATLWYSPHGH